MLLNLIIMTGAGLVIFEKEWVESKLEKSSLFGSLIRSMLEFSKQSTMMIPVYLEFGTVSISIVEDPKTKLICTLIHEISDGEHFGQIIASQILRSFLDTFNDVSFSSGTVNVSMFSVFSSKILDAISQSIIVILQDVQRNKGVQSALLIYDDGTAKTPMQEEDQFGFVANLQPIITISTDIMLAKKDRPKFLSLEMQSRVVIIHKVRDASLVCVCRKSKSPSVYMPAIEHARCLLENVMALSHALSSHN